MAHLNEEDAEKEVLPDTFEKILFIIKIDRVGIDVGDQIIR